MNISFNSNEFSYDVIVNTEYITIPINDRVPDKNWTYIDLQGHHHMYFEIGDHYPTLKYVIDKEIYCDGWDDHDPHQQIEESHYECRECSEVIEPGTVWKNEETIPGMTSTTLKVDDGKIKVEAILTEDQLEQIKMARTQGQLRLILKQIINDPQTIIRSTTIHQNYSQGYWT
jgi:hypothetical protein